MDLTSLPCTSLGRENPHLLKGNPSRTASYQSERFGVRLAGKPWSPYPPPKLAGTSYTPYSPPRLAGKPWSPDPPPRLAGKPWSPYLPPRLAGKPWSPYPPPRLAGKPWSPYPPPRLAGKPWSPYLPPRLAGKPWSPYPPPRLAGKPWSPYPPAPAGTWRGHSSFAALAQIQHGESTVTGYKPRLNIAPVSQARKFSIKVHHHARAVWRDEVGAWDWNKFLDAVDTKKSRLKPSNSKSSPTDVEAAFKAIEASHARTGKDAAIGIKYGSTEGGSEEGYEYGYSSSGTSDSSSSSSGSTTTTTR
ncbi:hypothetical protein RRG08_039062 [Elysia crispata]|uniref:Uncharacterized protein n=1 Tax=Elysia crispata TaxID=231223 RepID=A0AAE1DG96_9GAST|nr:hypothetical protein RRG08_039062 [Elysia crispata]